MSSGGCRVVRTRSAGVHPSAIGAAYGVSPSVVAVSWVISFYGDTVVAIPGASKPAHARDSAAAMDLRLTDRELTRLNEASQKARR